MKLLPRTVRYKNQHLVIGITHYDTSPNHKAIVSNDFKTGEPVAAFTRNFPGKVAPDEVAIDINNCGTVAVKVLAEAKIIGEKTLRWITSECFLPNDLCF